MLYTFSGCTVLTAFSVESPAMSSASMYSQDSWKTASPSVPAFVVEANQASPADTVQLTSSHIEEEDSDKGFTSKSPSAPTVFTPPLNVLFPVFKGDNDTEPHSKFDDVPPLANNAIRNSVRNLGSLRTLGKRLSIKPKNKKIDQHSSKLSKSSKSIRKVMNRLSFLPSKRELAQL